MAAVQNIIRRQTVNFRYNGNTDAFALQKEVSDWCTHMLIPEIEQQLELFEHGDNYITIDKLAIDATIDKKDWQQKLRNELVSSLNQKLRDYKPTAIRLPDDEKTERRLFKLDELVLFYFEKGYLPWWSKAFVDNNFDTVLTGWLKEEKSVTRSEAIIVKLQQVNTDLIVQRILNQAAVGLFFKFLHHIFKRDGSTIAAAGVFFDAVVEQYIVKTKQKKAALAFGKAMLAMLIKNSGKMDIQVSVQVARHIIENETKKKPAMLKTGRPASLSSPNPFITAWQNLLTEETEIKEEENTEQAKIKSRPKHHRTMDELINRPAGKNSAEEIAEDLREGIYIENAGAVVIAAFLPRLFERLKISNSTEIVNPELGALMIQYIVGGNTKIGEHELVLPKILCGISIEEPVNTAKKITRQQRAEADEMLAAVIEHWGIMKGTSVDGLRESFLKRSGKLLFINDEWILRVEQKAYDMLLQQLPWSISMIRLPWMKSVLKTEWF